MPYHHSDLRKELIEQALYIIENEGVYNLTLRKTARLAKVSHSAPLHHFTTKKGLLAVIAEEGFRRLNQQMSITQSSIKNPLLRLRKMGADYIDFSLNNRAYFKVMYHPELSQKEEYPELLKQSNRAFEIIKEAIFDCQQNNMIKKKDLDQAGLFVWATVHGFVNIVIDEQLISKGLKKEYQVYADIMLDFIYNGLHK